MRLTMSLLWDHYIEEHVKPSGCDVTRTLIARRKIEGFYGPDFRVKRMERDDGRRYTMACRAKGVADGTIRRDLSIFKAALNHEVKERRLKYSPYVELPPSPPPRERYLDEAEMHRVFVEARANIDRSVGRRRIAAERTWYFLWLAAETWARAGAIQELTVGRVDLWSRRVVDYRVPGARITKKRRGEVAISDALWPVLYEAVHRWGPPWRGDLVIGPGTPRAGKPPASTYNAVKRIKKLAGINEKGVARHVWRKTGPSHSIMNGSTLEEAAAILHDTPQTTARSYARFKTERALAAVNRKPPPMLLPAVSAPQSPPQ